MLEIISVLVINAITQLGKKIPAFDSLNSGWHKTAIRASALILSYIGACLTTYIAGEPVDLSPVTQAVPTALMFLATQGTFFLFRGKKNS